MDLTEVPQRAFRRHPWEVARAQFFGRVAAGALAQRPAPTRPARVLDIGAGDGYLGRQLLGMAPAGSTVTCVDPHYSDQDLERFASPATPGLSFARARPDGTVDLILMLDVIEHVADDQAFVTDALAGSLDAAGVVLVSVPAWDLLYGRHDLALKHFRRYQPAQCRALLRSAGLEIVRGGGLFHSLLLPRIAQRLGEAVRGTLGSLKGGVPGGGGAGDAPANLGEWRGGPWLSAAVTRALAVDTRLSERLARRGRQWPGLSYWALCRRVAGS